MKVLCSIWWSEARPQPGVRVPSRLYQRDRDAMRVQVIRGRFPTIMSTRLYSSPQPLTRAPGRYLWYLDVRADHSGGVRNCFVRKTIVVEVDGSASNIETEWIISGGQNAGIPGIIARIQSQDVAQIGQARNFARPSNFF